MSKQKKRVTPGEAENETPIDEQAVVTPSPAGRKRKLKGEDLQLPSLLIHLEASNEAAASFLNAIPPFKACVAAYGSALKAARSEPEASAAFDQFLAPGLLRLRDCLNSVEKARNLLPSAAGEISHSRMALHRKHQIYSEDMAWGPGGSWEARALPAPPLPESSFSTSYQATNPRHQHPGPGSQGQLQLPSHVPPPPTPGQRFLEFDGGSSQGNSTILRANPSMYAPPLFEDAFDSLDPMQPIEVLSELAHSMGSQLPSGASPSSLKPLTAPLTVGSYELPTQEEFASWQRYIETLLDTVFAHLVSVLIVNRNPSCDHSHSTNKNNIKRFASSLLRYLHPKERYEAVRYARGLEERGELRVVLSSLLEQIRALGIQIMTMPDNPGVHQETQLVNEFARLFPYIIDPLTYLSTLKQSVALGINLFSANVTDFRQYMTLIKEQPTVHHACFRFQANNTIEFIAPPNLRAILLKTFRTPVNIYRYFNGSYLFSAADSPGVVLPPENAL